MIYFILAAIIVTILLKRNPVQLINLSFRWPFLIIGSFGTQIALAFITIQTKDKYEIILIATFVCMVLGLWLNRRMAGMKWILIGAILNLLALILHGGLMPVSETAIRLTGQDMGFDTDSRHQLMDSSSPFWFLGDWIPLVQYILSPGDLLVGIGLFRFFVVNSKHDAVLAHERR